MERSRALRLDWSLRFDDWVAERYERERGAERARSIAHLVLVGLVLYNVYNFTAVFLVPDILWLSIMLRVLVVTPASFVLVLIIVRVGPRAREALTTAGMLNAFATPVALFWLSEAPLSAYSLGDFVLTLVYGNMLLPLRFRHAVVFTGASTALAITVVLAKHGLDDGLRVAFVIQTLTGGIFTLYANYRVELVRCRSYLEELGAVLRSEESEAARNRFLDLSMTDALTGLPNRRSLDRTVEDWTSENRTFAILMIDVDHFKLFNDTLGHHAGDDCLRAVGAALAGAVMTGSVVARFGGEEFTALVRDCDVFAARQHAEDLVKAVERSGIRHPSRPDGLDVVTVSVGIGLSPGGLPPAVAFRVADEALYAAKRGGRNRSAFADGAQAPPLQAAG